MTTTRKPAARKTTAAAKKTTRAPRKTAAKVTPLTPIVQPSEEVLHAPVQVVTEAQKQAKLEAYHTLKSAGLEVPYELASEVEIWVQQLNAAREAEAQEFALAQQTQQDKVAQANQNGPWYVRNGYPAPFNLRLDRQTESRRIELKPRGNPGDLHPLKDEDLKDPVLRQNLGLGLIEIVPAGEAALIIEKQTTNMGHRVHTPLNILRNQLGQPYQQGAVKVEAEFNSQGVTVAAVDPRIMQGQVTNREIASAHAGGSMGGGLDRVQPGQQVVQPAQPQPAGSVVHSAFVPTGGAPASLQYGADAQAKIVDDLARRKNLQGPAAGLGDVTVSVGPVQRT